MPRNGAIRASGVFDGVDLGGRSSLDRMLERAQRDMNDLAAFLAGRFDLPEPQVVDAIRDFHDSRS